MILKSLDSDPSLKGSYSVLYADPPWTFSSWSEKGEEKSAQNHYDCMSIDELKALPVGDISADNAIMFMWATDPLLPKQIEVMESWGFIYRTMGFVWVKMNKRQETPFVGLGYYTRSNTEYCLIGVKGSVGRPNNRMVSKVIMSPIREHSRKPDHIPSLIETMYYGPYLELFARTERPGWDSFGNQTDKFTTNELF